MLLCCAGLDVHETDLTTHAQPVCNGDICLAQRDAWIDLGSAGSRDTDMVELDSARAGTFPSELNNALFVLVNVPHRICRPKLMHLEHA